MESDDLNYSFSIKVFDLLRVQLGLGLTSSERFLIRFVDYAEAFYSEILFEFRLIISPGIRRI